MTNDMGGGAGRVTESIMPHQQQQDHHHSLQGNRQEDDNFENDVHDEDANDESIQRKNYKYKSKWHDTIQTIVGVSGNVAEWYGTTASL